MIGEVRDKILPYGQEIVIENVPEPEGMNSVLASFYTTVRPFGFWGPVQRAIIRSCRL